LKRDSSSRRRHALATIQARLLAVHFYLEARAWPAEFVLDHRKKIAVFTELAGCPLSTLPQRGGQPYLREHFVLWQPDWRLGIAMIDQPQPGMLQRLRLFIREFLPLLRHLGKELDLLMVCADKGRCHTYERLLKRHRSIQKLGLLELSSRIRTYCVKQAPSITGLTWPKAEEDSEFLEVNDGHNPSHSHPCQKHSHELIYE